MTDVDLKKEVEDNGYSFIKRSWFYIMIAVFILTTGINIGVSQNQLAQKVDKDQSRKIAKEEVQTELKHFFTDSDGRVLQSQMKDLEKQVEKMNQKLDRLLEMR